MIYIEQIRRTDNQDESYHFFTIKSSAACRHSTKQKQKVPKNPMINSMSS